MRRWLRFATCWLALGATQALAQGLSVSHSTWIVSGNTVTLRYQLPVAEAGRLTGSAVPLLTISRLEDYLLAHLSVQSGGVDCPAIDQGFDLGRIDPLAVGADQYGFEIFYRCADARQLTLRNTALFAQSPNHVNFATVQVRDVSVPQVFTAQSRVLQIPDRGAPAAAGSGVYLRLGFARVLFSAGHWCVLLGSLLLSVRARAAALMVAALAGGYLLALLLSLEGGLLPRPMPLSAFIGLLVLLLGAALAQRESRDPRAASRWTAVWIVLIAAVALLRAPWALWTLAGGALFVIGMLWLARSAQGRPAIWLGVTAVMGFLDGFVLQAALSSAQLSSGVLTRVTIGYDLGAVLFAALWLAAAVGIAQLLRRRRAWIPAALFNDVCAAGLAGLGAFWVLSRLG